MAISTVMADGAKPMKLVVAIILNVALSVGAMCILFVLGINFWITFMLFLAVFIPVANHLSAKITGVNVKERLFQ